MLPCLSLCMFFPLRHSSFFLSLTLVRALKSAVNLIPLVFFSHLFVHSHSRSHRFLPPFLPLLLLGHHQLLHVRAHTHAPSSLPSSSFSLTTNSFPCRASNFW